jgi:ParB family transcriptional regulator, chromosome partitioning protein
MATSKLKELQLLATATRHQHKGWLASFQAENDPYNDTEGAPRGHDLKQWLFGTEQIATGAALFPLD